MGFFNRMAERSSRKFWAMAANYMRPDDKPVDYAHLRCVDDGEQGILFLTEQQLIWLITRPDGTPTGQGFGKGLSDFVEAGLLPDDPQPGAFAVAGEFGGEEGMMMTFHPQQPGSRASQMLAVELSHNIRRALGFSV